MKARRVVAELANTWRDVPPVHRAGVVKFLRAQAVELRQKAQAAARDAAALSGVRTVDVGDRPAQLRREAARCEIMAQGLDALVRLALIGGRS